jgi:SpoVK/Ycf46/Vps4 family AAA+-type ATPase
MKLQFISTNSYYRHVLEYIYKLEKENIDNFFYLEEINLKSYSYRNTYVDDKEKILIPGEIDIDIHFENEIIKCKHFIIKDDKQNIEKLLVVNDCCGGPKGQVPFCKLELEHENTDILTKFVDKSRDLVRTRLKKYKEKSKETIRIYYYKDYWYLFSKIPKRSIETLYLKKNELDKIIENITDFFSDNERNEYLSFGMPYKHVTFLYGVPGSGKTSTINTIASHFDCDIYMIPLSTDMDDSHLVDAFSNVNSECSERGKEDNRKVIVIEDIDCIFNDRKKGDSNKNGITLQGLLNCLDGFTCIEGVLIFITANNPESLDNAVIRSSRVDYKLELSYADKYQTECMFNRFLPEQKYNYNKFYNSIKHYKYTTAILQELLFFNRKCINILDKLDDFKKIVEKNNSNELSNEKNIINHYM